MRVSGGAAQVEQFGFKVREAKLRWSEQILSRESKYVGQRTLIMEQGRVMGLQRWRTSRGAGNKKSG